MPQTPRPPFLRKCRGRTFARHDVSMFSKRSNTTMSASSRISNGLSNTVIARAPSFALPTPSHNNPEPHTPVLGLACRARRSRSGSRRSSSRRIRCSFDARLPDTLNPVRWDDGDRGNAGCCGRVTAMSFAILEIFAIFPRRETERRKERAPPAAEEGRWLEGNLRVVVAGVDPTRNPCGLSEPVREKPRAAARRASEPPAFASRCCLAAAAGSCLRPVLTEA